MGLGQKWLKGEEAVTALEFALVAIPFIFIMMGIIELSLMFAAMSTLDYATGDAARKILTGQVQQTTGDPEQLFRDTLCDSADTFLDCSKIQYEVIRIDGFSDFGSFPPTYDEEGNLESNGFDAGSVDDVILIRTVYNYQLVTPLIAPLLSDIAGNKKRIVSTIVLETEPYDVEQVVDEL